MTAAMQRGVRQADGSWRPDAVCGTRLKRGGSACNAISVDRASELIACSLSSGEAKDRAQEWATLLERGGAELTPVTDGLRIALRHDTVGAELDRLVAAECECCPFMSMQVERGDDVLTLTVTAPAEAQPLLAELFGIS
jgi:hypothetical protein